MIKTTRQRELELLLRLAQSHRTCAAEQARIEGDEIVIPFDCLNEKRSPAWTIEYERVRSRRDLLEVLGY
jgi:hypothetical protein